MQRRRSYLGFCEVQCEELEDRDAVSISSLMLRKEFGMNKDNCIHLQSLIEWHKD